MYVIVITGIGIVDCVGPYDTYKEASEAMCLLPTYGKDMFHDIMKLHK